VGGGGTHPDVAVNDEADAEQAVEERRGRAGCHERCGRERDQAGGEQSLEGPVVRPGRLFRRREGRRVVHGALVDRYQTKASVLRATDRRTGVVRGQGKGEDVRPPGT
jgi:hypothetical protein